MQALAKCELVINLKIVTALTLETPAMLLAPAQDVRQ